MRRNGSTPEIALPTVSLVALRRALIEEVGADAAARALRRAGCAAGDALYPLLVGPAEGGEETGPAEMPGDVFWRNLGELLAARGWGRLDFEPVHPGVGALDSADWVEADPDLGAVHPCCHFTTGMLANLLGRAAGGEVGVLEAECRSRGDLRCRFLFGNREALTAVHTALASGAGTEESLATLF